MSYYSDNLTDAELEALEKRIAEVFKQAEKDLDKEVKEYFAKFKLRDKEMNALVDAGEMTKAEYQQWRMTQMGRGKRFEALRDKVAERYTQANEVANAYVNDATPSIYSLNRNYEAYTIEKAVGSCDFTMWDESTVRRLLVEQPDLMPYYPPSRALNRGIDLAYGKSQITKHITSGIIRGLPPGKIANELMASVTGMNRDSAVRAARTGITAAQNAGRMDSYVAAEKMGIQIKRRWVCTKDSRTRLDHGMADGQIVIGTKQPFDVGGYKMMFPGDKSLGAPGHEIYNCRCTTRTVEKDGIEAEPRQMRVRNPETGEWELVNEMTYSEWMKWKETGKPQEQQKTAKPKKKSEKSLEKSVNGATMKVQTGGRRNETPLTESQIEENVDYAISLGMKREQVRYGDHYNTSYGSTFDIVYLGTDLYPAKNGKTANERISNKGALAHEIVGHRETFKKGTSLFGKDDLLDEVQASIRAARFAPGLTVKDRNLLLRDAMDRLRKDGRRIREVRHLLDIERR